MESIDRYFDIENKNLGFVPSHKILMLRENKVEILNGPDSDLEYVGFSQNLKTRKYDVNADYNVNEVSRNRAGEIIREQEEEWSLLREYMGSLEDRSSDHLTKNTMRLY